MNTGHPAVSVLLAGASGFVGTGLCPELEKAGYRVHAMTRHPDRYHGAGEPLYGDVADTDSLTTAAESREVWPIPRALAGQRRFRSQGRRRIHIRPGHAHPR